MAGTAVKRKQATRSQELGNKKQKFPSKTSQKVEEAAVEFANEASGDQLTLKKLNRKEAMLPA